MNSSIAHLFEAPMPRKSSLPAFTPCPTGSLDRMLMFAARCRLAWLVACLFLLAGARSLQAQTEEGIKAAYIFNFAKFCEWPLALGDASAPIVVGFADADSLADSFEKNVAGKSANGRDFLVKKISDAAAAEGCQIVYVGDGGKAPAFLGAVKGKPVLTMGGSEGFASAGGMVNFHKEGTKVTFDLDLSPVKSAGLKLDAKLQSLARATKGG